MSLNTAIQVINSDARLFYYYKQVFARKRGFYYDSSYINYITFENNTITIKFPEYCDIISNIIVTDGSYKIQSDNFTGDNYPDILILKKYKNPRIHIYNIMDNNRLHISFDVYLLKNKLKSLL